MDKYRYRLLCSFTRSVLLISVVLAFISTTSFATIQITNIQQSTAGNCDGTIEVTATGTAGPFSLEIYLLDSNDGSLDLIDNVQNYSGIYLFDNLCVAEYTIFVRNQFSCDKALEAEIMICEESPINISGQITNQCTNTEGGAIDILVSGGTDGNYTSQWSNGAITQDITGLSVGDYQVTVTDGGGCTGTASYIIEDFIDPDFSIQIESVGCVCPGGFANIDISVSGNSGPYTYQWSGVGNYTASEEDVEVYQDGSYSVTVTNVNGCSIDQSFVVDECSFNANNFNASITHSCDGQGTGSIFLQTGGGAQGPYIFVWETIEGEEIETGQSELGYYQVEGLSADTYCVTVFSANGCQASMCDMVVDEYLPVPEFTYTITPASDNSTADGAIDLQVTNGTGDETYLWNNGATTQDINNLFSGEYTVTIGYGNGTCQVILNIDVYKCGVLAELLVSAEVMPKSNVEVNDGAINLTVENFNGYEFNYSWSMNGIPNQFNTQDLTNLGNGSYCVNVTHSTCPDVVLWNDCFVICKSGLNLEVGNIINCDTYELNAIVTGGGNPYKYTWSNGSNSPSTIAIFDEEMCVTVTDAIECQSTLCYDFEITDMELDFSVMDAVLGSANGSVTANVSNDLFLPLIYNWDNGMVGKTISGLYAGSYCVTIVDDCGRVISDCAVVECEIASSDVVADITSVYCGNQTNEGSIDLTIQIDQGTYNTYNWSNGETTEDITGLSVGEYCVTVVNHPTNCVYTNCYVIETTGNGNFNIGFESAPSCSGGAAGSITAIVEGGSGPYTYSWTTWSFPGGIEAVGEGPTLSGVGPDWYTVHVTDALGCTDAAYHLFWPTIPTIDFDIVLSEDGVCEGETLDAYVSNITGGVEPYTIEWRSAIYQLLETGTAVTDLSPGWYIVKVEDAEGCRREKAFQVIQYNLDNYSVEITNACAGYTNGIISIDSPFENFNFTWGDGSDASSIENLSPGNYCVTLTNDYGCSKTDCFNVGSDYLGVTSAAVTDSECAGGCSGSIVLDVTSSETANYEWSNGATTSSVEGLCTGTYNVSITSGNCSYNPTYTIDGEDEFVFEVEYLRYFNLYEYPQSALVRIYSNSFTSGILSLYADEDLNYFIDSAPNGDDNYFTLEIDIDFFSEEFSHFYFTYDGIYSGGCYYEGSYKMPTDCKKETGIEDFYFNVQYQGDGDLYCGAMDMHTYHVYRDLPSPANPPYFLRVSMVQAAEGGNEDFELIIEDDQSSSYIQVDNVPSGMVRFEYYSLCDELGNVVHTNCCPNITCEVNGEGYVFDQYDGQYGNYQYNLNYVSLFVRDLCFDAESAANQDESEVVPSLGAVNDALNCWYGTVTIDYPGDEPDAVLVVDQDGDNNYSYWVTNDNSWDPPAAGNYIIRVIYEGDDQQGSGMDCVIELEVNFYGLADHQDAIVFRDDYWLPTDFLPDGATNAYMYAHNCQTCMVDGEYLFDADDCEEMYNYQYWTTFDYFPFDYDNACDGGGLLKVIDFDQGGAISEQYISVPPNISVNEFFLQALHRPPNQYCQQSGWCHFKGYELFGQSGGFYTKPILATWYNPETCSEPNDPSVPPCSGTTCPFGECINGICVESESACVPPCPEGEGYICDNGECVLNPEGGNNLPCADPCDCPLGQTCVGGTCQSLTSGECAEGCQCPPDQICDNGQCIDNDACNTCTPGEQFCKYGQCIDCPTIYIEDCYDDCGIDTDCVLQLYLSSSEDIVVQLEIFKDGQSVYYENIALKSYIKERNILIDHLCEGGYLYTVAITHDQCNNLISPNPLVLGSLACTSNCSGFTGEDDNYSMLHSSNDYLKDASRKPDSGEYLGDTDIKTEKEPKFKVYPNPFKNVINIEYNANRSGEINVSILDLYGRIIQANVFEVYTGKNFNQIDLIDKFIPGVYFVKITNENGENEVKRLLHVE